MSNINYMLTDQSLTVVDLEGGHVHQCDAGSGSAETALDLIRNGAPLSEVIDAMTPRGLVDRAFADDCEVTISGNSVLFRGENVPHVLQNKLLSVVASGLDPKPWKRFIVRLFRNPSTGAQAELMQFIEGADLPITEDGCFLAYKRVRGDYRDCYSGRFDNSPGNVVEMPREQVDPIRSNLCSRGLHFCSKGYLRSFGGERIVIVKIDPGDVVSIPEDYSFTKGRTWRYEVVGEIDNTDEAERREWGIYDASYESSVVGGDDEYDEDFEYALVDPEGAWVEFSDDPYMFDGDYGYSVIDTSSGDTVLVWNEDGWGDPEADEPTDTAEPPAPVEPAENNSLLARLRARRAERKKRNLP